jgi:very-short-patch-repair endonuclease
VRCSSDLSSLRSGRTGGAVSPTVGRNPRSLNLVIEVDGYHHFQDPEAFRRDRRKDLELQKHGYLVARFLADDIVERLEDVMDAILKAVAFRRASVERP